MAMEDLLRIAERTEDLPDQALAQIAASGSGIESVIAASEMKARSDIREDAQMMQNQAQPPVVDQLINMAMRQPTPPMGAPMPPQMQPPMGQPMPPQMGMQQPMPQSTPPQMAPDMAQLAQQMGVPAMNTGGLIRRFQTGTQGTIGGPSFLDFFMQQQGFDPRALLANQDVYVDPSFSLTPEQIDDLQEEYEKALSGTGEYSDAVEAASKSYRPIITAGVGPMGVGGIRNPLTRQQVEDQALQDARMQKATQLFSRANLPKGTVQSVRPVGGGAPVQVFSATQRNILPGTFKQLSALAAPATTQTATGPASATTQTIPGPAGAAGSAGGPAGATTQTTPGPAGGTGVVPAGTNVPTKDTDPANAFGLAFQPFSIKAPQIGPTSLVPYEQSQQFKLDQAASGPLSSIRIKQDTLNAQRLQNLIDREDELARDVKERAQKLDDLEKELPTRENIKDRIKEQTRLGMAQAFFDAAGSGSPDFLTAVAKGFGGAAGVMNKMTGQEQKELYQFALDNYNRESQKANRDYTRQQNLLNQINSAQTAQITLESNRASNDLQRRRMQQDSYYTLMGRQVDVGKANLQAFMEKQKISVQELNDFRDAMITVNANRAKAISDINSIESTMRTKDPLQSELYVDVSNDFASQYNKGAQINENNGLKRVVKRVVKAYQDLDQVDNEQQRRQSAIDKVVDDLIDEEKIGDRAVLDKYGQEIFALVGGDKSRLKAFYEKYPHLNPKILAYAVQ